MHDHWVWKHTCGTTTKWESHLKVNAIWMVFILLSFSFSIAQLCLSIWTKMLELSLPMPLAGDDLFAGVRVKVHISFDWIILAWQLTWGWSSCFALSCPHLHIFSHVGSVIHDSCLCSCYSFIYYFTHNLSKLFKGMAVSTTTGGIITSTSGIIISLMGYLWTWMAVPPVAVGIAQVLDAHFLWCW